VKHVVSNASSVCFSKNDPLEKEQDAQTDRLREIFFEVLKADPPEGDGYKEIERVAVDEVFDGMISMNGKITMPKGNVRDAFRGALEKQGSHIPVLAVHRLLRELERDSETNSGAFNCYQQRKQRERTRASSSKDWKELLAMS